MSRIQWFSVFAVGTVVATALLAFGWLSFWEYQNEHTQQRQRISTYQAETGEQYAGNCLKEGITFAGVAKCLVQAVDANREAQRSKYDLQAQQEMAEANANTLKAIGQEQVNSHRELRAYLSVESIQIVDDGGPYFFVTGTTQGPPPLLEKGRLKIDVKNSGQTPATNTTLFAYCMASPLNMRLPPDLFENEMFNTDKVNAGGERNMISRFRLTGNQSHVVHVPLSTIEPWRKAERKEAIMFVFGRIYYMDAFKTNWRTTFCYFWEAEPERRFVPYEIHNEETEGDPPAF